MNPHTPTDNNHIFQQPSGSSPRYREEATRSWWMDVESRQAFTEAAERERVRMARSAGAKLVRGLTIGWAVSGNKP